MVIDASSMPAADTKSTDYDVIIAGGAFSGSALALLLKRARPQTRVLIIEKSEVFDRKVGESTSEVSGCFLTRVLGLSN
jgi:flavin-dependent dehydrogenase